MQCIKETAQKSMVAILLSWALVSTATLAQSPRITDQKLLHSGNALFQQHCAICHGQRAEGTVSNWQQRDENGKLPPPPLNGTAHAWHHPVQGLAHTIKNGTLSIGGSMPAWKDKLDDEEIFAIIIWIASLWPDELYNSWMQRNSKQ
jgi:mono/diheme cytochrome c family protein